MSAERLETQGKTPEVWGRVPQRNKNFTGREELLARLRRSMGTVTAVVPLPQALHGLGGVGKTQLAVEYAWRYRSDYDVVWWIAADQRVLIAPAMAALAPRLGLPHADTMGPEDAAEAVREALQRGDPFSRWLLVFDNADEPESIKGYIPANGHVLITSRNTRWDTAADTVSVNVFTRAESVEFLAKRVPGLVENDAHRLADALGDLPLALEQAGALLAQTAMSVDDYLTALEENAREVLGAGKSTEYPLSMTAAWRLSVAHLARRAPEAVDILRCCAFFGPEPIPRDMFRRGAAPLSPRLADLLSRPMKVTKAVGELNRFALARIDSETRTIQVHRLVQALVRDDLTTDQQSEIRHEVHCLLGNGAPKDPDAAAGWRAWADLVAHLRPSQVADCEEPTVREFAVNTMRYLYRRGDYRTAGDIAQELLEKWTKQSGPFHRDVLTVRRHLGNMLWQLGRYDESYQLNTETLELMREHLAPEHPETLGVINNYGANLRARGEFARAKTLDLESRDLHEKIFGRTDARTLRVVTNLALDHVLVSDLKAAYEQYEHAYLEQTTGTAGASTWDILYTMIGLARVTRLRGDFADACDLGADAYDYGRTELGADHPLTLMAAKDLAIAKRLSGDISEALELTELAYTKLKALYGVGHPDTLAAAVALANTQRTAGDLQTAFSLTRETVSRYTELYGNRHPYTLGCRSNLALLYRLRGHAAEALKIDEEIGRAVRAEDGTEHDYLLSYAINLASDHAALGDHATAKELGGSILQTLRTRLGENHYFTFCAMANFVLDLQALGEHAQAERLYETMRQHLDTSGTVDDHRRAILTGGRADVDFDPPPL